jgi:hypothetical protein
MKPDDLQTVRDYFKWKNRVNLKRSRFQAKQPCLFGPIQRPNNITIEVMTRVHVNSCGFQSCMTCNALLSNSAFAKSIRERRKLRGYYPANFDDSSNEDH